MRITPRAVALALVLSLVAGCGSTSDEASPDAGAAGTSAPGSTAPAASDPDAPLAVDEVTETFVDRVAPDRRRRRDRRPVPERTIRLASCTPPAAVRTPCSSWRTAHPATPTSTPSRSRSGPPTASSSRHPAFPLTNRDVPGALRNFPDVVNQPGDVSFVIDQVLAANEDPDSPLHGLVDPEAIGMVGHSLGGATTWAVAFNTATRDERIDSATVFAGLTLAMPGGEFAYDSGLPLLVMHGDADDVPIDMDHRRPTSRRRRRSGSSR